MTKVEHFAPSVWGANEGSSSRYGLENMPAGHREVTEISLGDRNFKTGDGLNVRGVPVSGDDIDEAGIYWSANGGPAHYIHYEAFTDKGADPETLAALYKSDADRPSQHSIGSFARLNEFIETHSVGNAADRRMAEGYREGIDEIPAGAIMNWQFLMLEGAASIFAPELRERGVLQTFHIHEPIPDNLYQSEWGRGYLKTLSQMDIVYVHTELFKQNLETQTEMMGLRQPEIKRFDLALGQKFIAESLEQITRGNYEEILDTSAMSPRQLRMLTDAFRSSERGPDGEERVKHRYMCADRVTPFKGSPAMLDGIDAFLQSRRHAGASMLELQQNFRFYLLEDASGRDAANPTWREQRGEHDLYGRYWEHALDKMMKLEAKWPGIVFTAEHFGGANRAALPVLMKGCHGITGGATEGFNLSIGETALASDDSDTTVVSGTGAGFAIRMKEQGLANNGFFVEPGKAENFREAIEQVTRVKEENPGELRERKRPIIRALRSRSDAIVVGGEELLKK